MYKLLIADDESLEREALCFFAKQSSLDIEEIIECADGNEVVKKALLYHPDIIVLDINMPGLNGLDAFEQFKNASFPCRVIFSTAYDYFEYAAKALKLGAMDFLVKPVKKEQFLVALEKAAGELDEEAKRASREEKVHNMLEHMGKKILTRLVTGDMDEEVLYYMETMGVSFEADGICFCFWTMGETGEEQKCGILKDVKESLSYLGIRLLCQWRNAMATFLLFFPSDFPDMMLQSAEEYMKRAFSGRHVAFICGKGSRFEDLSQIEQSFRTARESVGDLVTNGEKEEKKEQDEEEQEKSQDGLAAVRSIQEFIECNYEKHLTLDMIAEKAGYSKFYLNRLFKQHTDRTIMDYLIQTRISRAKELLENKEYTVKQISAMVGYSEPNYFTLTFKKSEGISPMKYRCQCRKEGET